MTACVPDADRVRIVLVLGLRDQGEPAAGRKAVVLQRIEPVGDARELDHANPWIFVPDDLLGRSIAQAVAVSRALEPEPQPWGQVLHLLRIN